MPFISQYKYIETQNGRDAFMILMNEEAKTGWKPVWNRMKEDPSTGFFSIYLYKKCRVNRLLED